MNTPLHPCSWYQSFILSMSCIRMSEHAFIGSSSAHLTSILVSPLSRRKCAPFDGGGGGGMWPRGPSGPGPSGPGPRSMAPRGPGGGGGGGASGFAIPSAGGAGGGGGGGCCAKAVPAAMNTAAPAIISFFMRKPLGWTAQEKRRGAPSVAYGPKLILASSVLREFSPSAPRRRIPGLAGRRRCGCR